MLKPQKLRVGDKVAIVSLSSGILGEAFARHQLALGIKRLEEFGLVPVFMKNALKGVEFLSKNPKARAQDLKDAFFSDEIKAIICAIGGDDTFRIIPFLLDDKEFVNQVKKSPKIFTGYSDTTINHFVFFKLGLSTYYGINFLTDLAELADEMLPYTKETFKNYFENPSKKEITSSPLWYEERSDFSEKSLGKTRVVHIEKRGYEVLRGKGIITGELLGGCLESIYEALSGARYKEEKEVCDRYKIIPEKDVWKGKVLFIETSEETPNPKYFKEMITALFDKGILGAVNGVMVGKPQNEKYYEEYKKVLLDCTESLQTPIIYNVNFGHAHPKIVLAYGGSVDIDLDNKKITLKEKMFSD